MRSVYSPAPTSNLKRDWCWSFLLAWAFQCELRPGIARNLRAPIAHSQQEIRSQFLDIGLQSQRIGHSLLVLNKASGLTAQISFTLHTISQTPINCGHELKPQRVFIMRISSESTPSLVIVTSPSSSLTFSLSSVIMHAELESDDSSSSKLISTCSGSKLTASSKSDSSNSFNSSKGSQRDGTSELLVVKVVVLINEFGRHGRSTGPVPIGHVEQDSCWG